MKSYTIKDIRELEPCYDPSKYLDENWEGTLIDILDIKECPEKDRIWVVVKLCDEKIAHTFACDCAERVLPIFEERYPDDKRPKLAIQAKRDWLEGKISDDELKDAVADADAAAYAYAAAVYAAATAASAAYNAAYDAAYGAAYGAAYVAAADAAERHWQLEHLKKLVGVD